MSRKEETIECPFCGEETIKVVKKTKFSASRRDHGRDFKMKLISTECEECGKEEKKLRKKLKKKGFPLS